MREPQATECSECSINWRSVPPLAHRPLKWTTTRPAMTRATLSGFMASTPDKCGFRGLAFAIFNFQLVIYIFEWRGCELQLKPRRKERGWDNAPPSPISRRGYFGDLFLLVFSHQSFHFSADLPKSSPRLSAFRASSALED